jgi:DNA-binding NtrC family response regulator
MQVGPELGGGSRLPRNKILIVDDEDLVRLGVRSFLAANGFEPIEAVTCQQAEEAFQEHHPDAVLLDFRLPDGTAFELLQRLRALDPEVPVLVLTGYGSIELAVRAIKEGAENFLTKPVAMPVLLTMLTRLMESSRRRDHGLADRRRRVEAAEDPFLGVSRAIRQLASEASRLAARDSPVLILGETGSGKGVLARWLHAAGPRAAEPFVDLNCAGLARDFLETELFGHEKGAFTGAMAQKRGLLEVAHGGTVFLDEIGELHAEVQPKMLKVLEEKRFRRLGSVRDQSVDIRLLAATHRDLSAMSELGSFRSDLYFRINTLPLRVPPLRERAEDIPILARHLAERLSRDLGQECCLTADVLRQLTSYHWPGNVRELRNVLERAILLADSKYLTSRDLRFEVARQRAAPPARPAMTLADLERQQIEHVLSEESGRVERAAKRLGISRSTLYNKIQKFGAVYRPSPEA